jgi:transcriptional regulator with XRE-family HTH domain
MTVQTDASAKVLRARFGAWLKEKREDAGLTQLDVAAFLDYAYPVMVSQVERGASVLPEHDLRLWSEVLRVNSKEFAKQFLYFCRPFIYECMYGVDPYVREKLPRGAKTIRSAPGVRSPRRSPQSD